MGSRCLIAKVENNGRGRYITLNHGGTPEDAGRILLEHYQDGEKLNQLLDHGDTGYIDPDPEEIEGHHVADDHEWEQCCPKEFEGGTQEIFGAAHMLGPEWIYCWTPGGWIAAKVLRAGIPESFFGKLRTLTPQQFQYWYDHNKEPQWIEWRHRCQEEQIPRPMYEVIQSYEDNHACE